jgi:hypothetical protein
MTDPLDGQLRARGERYRRIGDAAVPDLPGIDARSHRQRRARRLTVLAAAVAVLVVAVPLVGRSPAGHVETWGGQGGTAPVESAPPARPDIRAVDFARFPLTDDTCRPAGEWPEAPSSDAAEGSRPPHQEVTVQSSTYGDLTGDGLDEAVIAVSCTTEWSPAPFVLPWVFTLDEASPTGVRRLPFTPPGGDVQALGGCWMRWIRAAELSGLGAPAATTRPAPGVVPAPTCTIDQAPRIVDGALELHWRLSIDASPVPGDGPSVHTWTGTAWAEPPPASPPPTAVPEPPPGPTAAPSRRRR